MTYGLSEMICKLLIHALFLQLIISFKYMHCAVIVK